MRAKHIISATYLIFTSLSPVVHAETSSVRVSTQVQETCRFYNQNATQATPLIMTFPEIDPADTRTFTEEVTHQIRCTKGTRAQLLIGNRAAGPLAREMSAGPTGSNLRYRLDWTLSGSTGAGFGPLSPDLQLTLSATLAPADYQDAFGGHYTDIVPVSLNP